MLHGGTRAREQRVARLGQHHAACRTHQQLHTQAFLELAHAVADGRLREIEPFGRLRKTATLGHGKKGLYAQKIDLHRELSA